MATTFPRRRPPKDWTTLDCRVLPIGQALAIWDTRWDRGFMFMHPSSRVTVPGAIGDLARLALDRPDHIMCGVLGRTGPLRDDGPESLKAAEEWLDALWHEIELKVVLQAIHLRNGRIPGLLQPKVIAAMERVVDDPQHATVS